MCDLGEVAVLQRDLVEAAGRQVEGVLDGRFGRSRHLLAHEFPQVALAGDEGHHGDGAAGVAALHEVGDLAGLPGHELLVVDEGGEPEDQFVHEEDQTVVAERLRVLGDDGQTRVERDEPVLVLRCVLREPREQIRARVLDEAGTQLGRGGRADQIERLAGLVDLFGGERGVQETRLPGECLAPLVIVGRRGRVRGGQALDDETVPVALAQGTDVVEERVRPIHLRRRRLGMQFLHMADVAAEDPLLQGLRPEHVVWHEQEVLPCRAEPGVLGQYGVEVRPGAGGGAAAEQGVQHRHEVRLTGTERAVQIGSLGRVSVQRRLDQPQRLVEVVP